MYKQYTPRKLGRWCIPNNNNNNNILYYICIYVCILFGLMCRRRREKCQTN